MITTTPYWVNRHEPHNQLKRMLTHYNNNAGALTTAPVFMLSADDADTLAARISARHYTKSNTDELFHRSFHHCPLTHCPAPNTLSITDDGRMQLIWHSSNDESLYPYVDTSSDADRTSKMQSFAVWISELRSQAWSQQRFSAAFRKGHETVSLGVNVWLVGTVGDKGSGADIELEDVSTWRLGRPLYLPGNTLTLPFKFLPNLDVDAPVPVEGVPVTTGVHQNIALVGTNGLTPDSFSASNTYGLDAPVGAFDGYAYEVKINSQSSGRQARGMWMSGWQDGNHENQWLQVDFGTSVTNITGFSLRNSGAANPAEAAKFPKDVIVQLSNDGETFTDHEALTIPAEGRFRRVTLSAPATARVFRLFITNNYGSTDTTLIEEFEIYRG